MSLSRLLLLSFCFFLYACSYSISEKSKDLDAEEELDVTKYRVIEGTAPIQQEQAEDLESKIGDRIFFKYDSNLLAAEAQDVLKKQAEFMTKNPDVHFVIEGHCDERGTREYNLALGERRANAAKKYLVELGVDEVRLTTVSYGKERPAVLGTNSWHWEQNRRAVTVPR